MDCCSYFIPDKALFGSFPEQNTVNLLEEQGVRYFVDLTEIEELKHFEYTTKYNYIKYPIIDRKIPYDWASFSKLIIKICDIIDNLKNGEKLYLHCKGGHGRSGILVACIFCYYYGLDTYDAIVKTTNCHSNRPRMREKSRHLGSPQGKRQKDFVHKFFKPLKIYKPEMDGFTEGMHNLSNHSVIIPTVGTFLNAQLAFLYYKAPENKEYVNKLLNGEYCQEFLLNYSKDWDEKRIDYMYQVLEYKFRQHEHLKIKLLRTGLRPFIKISRDRFWGDDNGRGKNIFGKLLVKLRRKFLEEN